MDRAVRSCGAIRLAANQVAGRHADTHARCLVTLRVDPRGQLPKDRFLLFDRDPCREFQEEQIAVVGMLLYGEPLEIAVFAGAALILLGNLMNIRAESRKKEET